jgi:hypothetical protein
LETIKVCPIQERSEGMARHKELEDEYHKKIAPKQEGPFEINEVLGPVTY